MKRRFLIIPLKHSPIFAADNVLSVVYKQYVSKIRTQFGATYRYISGWPVYDPGSDTFLGETSPVYQDLKHQQPVTWTRMKPIKFTVVFASGQ